MCNFDCFYCHNRPLLSQGEAVLSLDEVDSFLRKRVHLIDAVVISGGEPTLHKEMFTLFEIATALSLKTKLDTNGSHPEVIHSLLDRKIVDYVALDIKAPKHSYQNFARYDGELIYETLYSLDQRYTHKGDFTYEIRTTVAPSLTQEDLFEITTSIPVAPLWSLQTYRVPEVYRKEDELLIQAHALKKEEIDQISTHLKEIQPNIRVL